MKRIYYLMVIGLIFIGCDKEIHITVPTILIKTEKPTPFLPVEISVAEYAEIDGTQQKAEYFKWDILDKDEKPLFSNFENSPSITWIPESTGYFIIKVEIGYDNNKSITILKEITVLESIQSIKKRLVGKWTGEAEAIFGVTWQIDIAFDSTGHYIAKAFNVSDTTYRLKGPFYSGCHAVDNWSTATWWGPNPEDTDYYQWCIELSEDIPCTRFEIRELKGNLGFGLLSVGFESEIWGQPYQYSCLDLYDIENFQFLSGDKELTFSLVFMGDDSFDWYLKYKLTRIE